jgi:uncharacterized repeat protein (TIGR03803 family)
MLSLRAIVILITLCGAALLALAPATAQEAGGKAPTKVLYIFNGAVGSTPNTISEVYPGKFIGNTTTVFSNQGSTIFSVTAAGDASIVYQFPALFSVGNLTPSLNGELFGEAYPGGPQDFFTITRQGTDLKVHQLPINMATYDSYPYFLLSPSGDFYTVLFVSTTQQEIARVKFDGTIQVLHTFAANEGTPDLYAGIARDAEGNFYGINDVNSNGVLSAYLYRLSADGTFTNLVTYSGGVGPASPLVTAPDGTVYGAMAAGGPYLTGSIYKFSPSTGQLTTLATFPKTGMIRPGSLLLADDGNLYGSTSSLPSYFFRLNLATNQLEDLTGPLYSEACPCPMVQGSNGKLYGISPAGGGGGGGVFFNVDAGLPPPQPMIQLFSPTQASAGTRVELWGSNLLGATSVAFDGIAGTNVLATTSQSVFVDVPEGATSGPLTITTPNGSFTTQQDFTVE